MMTQTPNIRQLAVAQLVVGVAFSAVGGVFSSLQLGASIGIGAMLMLGNLLVIAWSWQRLMDKKSIAWTVLVIVIKYAVLLGSIFYFAQMSWFSSLGAGLGIASFMFAALILAWMSRKKEIGPVDSF